MAAKRFRMLKRVLIGLALVVIGFLIVVALQPADYRVTRTGRISAPPAAVFAQVDDFHNWEAWSPWAKLDPAAKNTFEGPRAGVGAGFAWSGNDKVGEGRMTIIGETHGTPRELIQIKLEFIKPFASTCATEFAFEPQGDQTLVTWTMTGKNNFVAKAFCLFMNMDKTVGGDFEKGLANLKSVTEASAGK